MPANNVAVGAIYLLVSESFKLGQNVHTWHQINASEGFNFPNYAVSLLMGDTIKV